MNELLTAREVQRLLQVDRSTVYRMAEDGRLPAIKVGKQWRFRADQIESRFQIDPRPDVSPTLVTRADQTEQPAGETLAALLPLDCVQLLQDTFADMLGIMLVVTDMAGEPITEPSHTCGLFDLVRQQPKALQKCIDSWHDLAQTIDLEPKFSHSQLGLLCTRALIRVGAELKGMVVAGCVAPKNWPPTSEQIAAMAAAFELQPAQISANLEGIFTLSETEQQAVLIYVQRIANIIAHIVNERKSLVGRLETIANLTHL